MLVEQVDIPDGERGDWKVSRFIVGRRESEASTFRAMQHGRGYVRPGTYTQLTHRQRGVIMSDSPDERRDHYAPVLRAQGHVLINGLGIGVVLRAVLKKLEVSSVTVIEVDADVIDLVGPHYPDPRVNIVHASAYDYQPPKGRRYGMVWHDIWDAICSDNLPEMTRLKRKYGSRAEWQGCWAEYECRRMRARRY